MSNPILYEQPLNEKVRVFLRLEQFFAQMAHFQRGSTAADTQAAIAYLLEIFGVLERSDVRTDVIKELERQIYGLSRLIEAPSVDKEQLQTILDKLTDSKIALQKTPSKLNTELRDNELLTSIRQRSVISGGTCSFDLPAYHYLLNQPLDLRSQLICRWLEELNPLKGAVHLLLSLLRDSSLFEPQNAGDGIYQKSLDSQNPCQLVRIRVPHSDAVFPEVSGNKHRVNVRFLAFSENGRARQTNRNQEFEISFCTI